MGAVLITGCSGAGKTTLAAAFARRSVTAIDSDNDPLLARMVDADGKVVGEEPAEPDFDWLSRHSWAWDPARLDAVMRATAPSTLYVCGGAANELELADRFTHIFMLEIDEPTMLARIDARQNNDWGRIGDTREYLRRFLPEYQARLRAFGAIPVDARQPLGQVADAILARTLGDSAALFSKDAGAHIESPIAPFPRLHTPAGYTSCDRGSNAALCAAFPPRSCRVHGFQRRFVP